MEKGHDHTIQWIPTLILMPSRVLLNFSRAVISHQPLLFTFLDIDHRLRHKIITRCRAFKYMVIVQSKENAIRLIGVNYHKGWESPSVGYRYGNGTFVELFTMDRYRCDGQSVTSHSDPQQLVESCKLPAKVILPNTTAEWPIVLVY